MPVFHDPCFLIEFGGGNLLALLLFDNATEYITLCNCAWKGLFVHTFFADTSDEGITTWVFSADPSSGGFLSKEKGGAGGGRSPRPTWIYGGCPLQTWSMSKAWYGKSSSILVIVCIYWSNCSEKHFGSSFLAFFPTWYILPLEGTKYEMLL